MPLAREQLSAFLLAATYVVLAAVCGAALSTHFDETTELGIWTASLVYSAAIGVAAAESAMLACWQAMRKSTVTGWGASLLTLTLIGYAFALGGKFFGHSSAQGLESGVMVSVLAGICFFVVYAYLMPIAAFWQWQLVAGQGRVVQRSTRRLTLGQMFGWTLAITLPYGVSQLFVPDQAERTSILVSMLGLPILLLTILPVTFAAFDPKRSRRRIMWSLFWFIAIFTVELGIVTAVLFADRVRWGTTPGYFRTFLITQLLMLASLNVTCYLVAMFSSLWLRRSGYSFVVTSNDAKLLAQPTAV